MALEIREKFRLEDRIYFDLILDNKLTINHCFAERGEYGDLLLRLPTKETKKGIFQTVWFNDEELFKKIQQEVQSAGFKDAFVVAFLGNERISPSEAIRLMQELKSDNQ